MQQDKMIHPVFGDLALPDRDRLYAYVFLDYFGDEALAECCIEIDAITMNQFLNWVGLINGKYQIVLLGINRVAPRFFLTYSNVGLKIALEEIEEIRNNAINELENRRNDLQ